jgi:hypothetical protein
MRGVYGKKCFRCLECFGQSEEGLTMKLTWFDRLLIKIAVAKCVARGEARPEVVTPRLIEAFSVISGVSKLPSETP